MRHLSKPSLFAWQYSRIASSSPAYQRSRYSAFFSWKYARRLLFSSFSMSLALFLSAALMMASALLCISSRCFSALSSMNSPALSKVACASTTPSFSTTNGFLDAAFFSSDVRFSMTSRWWLRFFTQAGRPDIPVPPS